jgi:hypothetical protein
MKPYSKRAMRRSRRNAQKAFTKSKYYQGSKHQKMDRLKTALLVAAVITAIGILILTNI